MKLRHFSADVITRVYGRRQGSHMHAGLGKPNGLWVSDETRGAGGWMSWCRSERFRSYSLRYEHEVVLADNARILYLRSGQEIDEFAIKYKADSDLNGRMAEIAWPGRIASIYEIDWRRVAKKYQGIIITPYIWESRLGPHMWYYGWDCASGCIWNSRAIKSITMVKERKVPRKPTYWEARRKHRRQMEKMRALSKQLTKEKENYKYGREISTSKV